MSNTPAHFTLFVLSDWQGHCQGRLLQSRNELQKSPIPGCSFHHHWNRDVCGGSCGPHRLLVQAWTCIAVGPVSLVGGDRDKEETRWEEGKRQGWRRFLHLSWRRVPVLLKLNEEKRPNQRQRENKQKQDVWLSITWTAYWSGLNLYLWDATLPPTRYFATTTRRKDSDEKMTTLPHRLCCRLLIC